VTLGRAGKGKEIVGANVEDATTAPELQQFSAVHERGNIRPEEAVNLQIAVVAKHDPLLRIGDHHTLVEIVQGRTDKRISAQLRALDPAQRRQHPYRDGRKEAADNEAANHRFPDHARIGDARIACRDAQGIRGTREVEWPSKREQAHHDQSGNHDSAACLPVLVSHQSPADFCW